MSAPEEHLKATKLLVVVSQLYAHQDICESGLSGQSLPVREHI